MPAAPPVFTATGPPLRSADLTAEPPLQSQVCTASSTLLDPGMLATQGGHGDSPLLHSLYLLWVSSKPVTANHMSQVYEFRLQECSLGGLQLQSSCLETVKDLPQTTDISRKVWGDYLTPSR